MREAAKEVKGLKQDDSGLVYKDFRQIAFKGFGDAHNAYPHSMRWFKGHLYVGTTRDNLVMRGIGQDARWFGQAWPVQLPESIWDLDLRAQIWRYAPDASEWSKVFTSPVIKGVDGYDVPLSAGFRSMTPFQGKSDSTPALYIPTWATHQRPEAVMLRSIDGNNFDVVSEPNLGMSGEKFRVIRGLVGFKGYLFATPAMGKVRRQPNSAGAMRILCSDDPGSGNWQDACQLDFGNPNNLTAFQMAIFNGFLYAGTMNVKEGFEVWKTDAEGKPPFRWTRVLSNGAYRGRLNQIAMTLHVFNDHLYVGSAIQHGGFDVDNMIGPAPPEVIRIGADDSWELVAGDPRLTPDGLKTPISGQSGGFGNLFSGYIWSMCVHDGWIYAADAVWTTFMKYSVRSRWPKKLRKLFTEEMVDELVEKSGGFDIWRSRDGVKWTPVTTSGFENCYNLGVRNMVSTSHGMFVGAANPFAPRVAVRRRAGWVYEDNHRGGLEIWLGTHSETPGRESSEPSNKGASGRSRIMRLLTDKAEDSLVMLEKRVSAFYGGSGFRDMGFWKRGMNDAKAASENLMDEVLAFIADKKGRVLDINCGLGATTGYLFKYFKPADVTGITAGKEKVEACRLNAPGAEFVEAKAKKLNLPGDSFESIICVEGLGRFETRLKLLGEACRVLKYGGRFVFSDIIRVEVEREKKDFLKGKKETLVDLATYRQFLLKSGFKDIIIEDVTKECVDGFRAHSIEYLMGKVISEDISEEISDKIKGLLPNVDESVSKYIIVSVTK